MKKKVKKELKKTVNDPPKSTSRSKVSKRGHEKSDNLSQKDKKKIENLSKKIQIYKSERDEFISSNALLEGINSDLKKKIK